jgi:adenine specific DNA methylase mod
MAAINDLIAQIEDIALRERIAKEVDRLSKQKKFGLVFEEHLPECTPLYDIPVKAGALVAKKAGEVNDVYKVLCIEDNTAQCLHRESKEIADIPLDDLVTVAEFGEPIYPYLKPIDTVCNAPDSDLWHTLIEADNYHALQLLEYLYAGKVDCIYIDPPYNTGAKDWKYNNDYVDGSDAYRHSKWLSFMQRRLKLAKKLLNPKDSVLIVTIDEKEYLHLGCLLEELYPEAEIQMITDIINPRGTNRTSEFSRVEEYVFICRFGAAEIVKTGNNMLGSTDETDKARVWYGFNRPNNLRPSTNKQFFPIYIDETQRRIVCVGEPMELNNKIEDFPTIEGLTAVFPINSHGEESIWGAISSTTREWVAKGYLRVNDYDKKHSRWTFSYIRSGMQKRIESGEIAVDGFRSDGSLNIDHIGTEGEVVPPKSVWYQASHKSFDFGSTLIKGIIPGHYFSFPKSLYSTMDAIRFFVADKPSALIVDFFAGSGTTLHAVNLLNAEDGGHRRCILVTNNEVSDAEAKEMSKRGLKPGDEEWEKLGIARYVTWPRTVCSIEGHDVNGNPLKGNYIGSDIPMADGFKANAAFFKLSFLDSTAVSLGMRFSEMLPTLWLKAGAKGKCPELPGEQIPDMLILPENKFAVLINENAFASFVEKLAEHPEVQTVFLATDYEVNYQSMVKNLNVTEAYQLYRDYLDHFRLNRGRN